MANGGQRPALNPLGADVPGGWPQSSFMAASARRQPSHGVRDRDLEAGTPLTAESSPPDAATRTSSTTLGGDEPPALNAAAAPPKRSSSPVLADEDEEDDSQTSLAPITAPMAASAKRPGPAQRASSKGSSLLRTLSRRSDKHVSPGTSLHDINEDALFQTLSRRKTGQEEDHEEQAEIERLLSTIFGANRQAGSEEEKTRHVGVVFKNLDVKGQGLGASLQPTNSDLIIGPFRGLWNVLTGKAFRKTPVRTLIHDFSGTVRPQEMLLVLGRPGSGCSTFLKVLGNQRSGYESITGDVTYGGVSAEEMAKKFRGEVLYNPEEDLHYATLTVRDTLRFALTTRTPGKSSRREGESRQDYVREFLRVVSKLFWIEHTLDTKVGNDIIRGVSGGEKKRVSIAEAMITKASCQCWDNSTKGLDASTAMEYVASLRSLTNMAKISTIVALYQAGESLYNLFDKVILIEEGRCLYYGPTERARAYFENLGFVCQDRWTTADFLTSVTDKHERQVKEGWEDRIPRNAEEFEAAYRQSDIARANQQDIADFESTLDEQKEARAHEMTKKSKTKNYTIPFHKQVMACTNRQFKVMKGDPMSLGGKWGGILFQSLIVGSLFYNLPAAASGVFPRGGVMFFTLLFNALLALAELTAAFDSRAILLKHKSFSFYRPSAFAIAQVAVDVPLCLVQVAIWQLVIYFMSNLQRTASQFFIALLIVFVLTLSMYSFFRMIGAFSASLDSATRITGVAIQALVVYTGYLIPPSKMHPWFGWLRWINPVQYAFEAVMANEFYNLQIACEAPYLVPSGPGAQTGHQSCAIAGSQPDSATVNGADYIKQQFTYTRAHLWRNFGIIVAFWIFFVVMTAIGLELQKPNKGGAAVTVFMRGQAPKHVEAAMSDSKPIDEESGEKNASNVKEEDEKDQQMEQQVAKNDTVFTWQNVTYTIPYKGGHRKLLDDVQGYVRPGRLTCLMGESGAGKSTLLNTLAQRQTFGKVDGTFLVDGNPLPLSFQRATGFAEQQDVHEPTATVREALRFSALLRQPKEVPTAEKYDYVEKIITLLEMNDIAGATIGAPGSGLNQEQRKRLTIGVELSSKPELLLFLDEPTSGLDSGAAFNIVRFLRKLADAGQAILCTIHQPSAILFEHFDELLLLKSGGAVVYHGPLGEDSQTMVKYFEGNGAKKCPPAQNPAEYMLEAIGAGDPNANERDWGQVWRDSPEYQQRSREIEQFIEERKRAQEGESRRVDNREFAMPWTTQVLAVVRRSFIAFWRTPQYVIGMFALHIFTGLFNAFTFYKLGNESIDMQSRLFSIFMTLTISPPLIQQLQPKFLAFRDLFVAREKSSKIYHWSAFVIGIILTEIPYRLVAGTLYFVSWYFPIGYPRDSFRVGYTWMLLMLFELYYLGFGQAIAAFSPNELLASLLVPMFFLFVVSFCGVVVPYASIPYFWRSWMYHLTPFRYLVEGFLGVLTHGVPVRCASKEFSRFTPPSGQSCDDYTSAFTKQFGGYVQQAGQYCEYCQYKDGDQFSASFNVYYAHKWRDYGIFWAYVGFNFMVVFVLTWVYLGGVRMLLKKFKKQK